MTTLKPQSQQATQATEVKKSWADYEDDEEPEFTMVSDEIKEDVSREPSSSTVVKPERKYVQKYFNQNYVFPKHPGYNIYNFEGNVEAEYSTTPYDEVEYIAQMFIHLIQLYGYRRTEEKEKPSSITLGLYDANANVLGPILFDMTKYFTSVHGTELNKGNFDLLKANHAKYKFGRSTIE